MFTVTLFQYQNMKAIQVTIYLKAQIRKRRASLLVERVKSLLAIQETRVRLPGWEDPLENEMTAHTNILAWKIRWTEEPGRLQSMDS